MKTYLKILVLVFLFISFGIAKFYAIWPHLKEIYTSPELKDSLSRVPEDIHRLAPLDESNTRTFSLGYASFKLPQDVDAFLFRREEDAISIWFYGEQLKLNFERPLAVTHLYEMESFVKITNLTKTEWRQSRLLKATDDFDHTLVSLPDLILYYFQEIPLSYFRIFLMSPSRVSNHIWRLKAKMERSPPILKQVIPFESEHVVGVVFVGYLDEYGSNGLIYLTSHNRQIVQSLTFMNLPENTSLEPLWNILSGYKFSFDACPNKADINEMMNKSGIPVFDPDNEENTKSEMRSKLNEASTTP